MKYLISYKKHRNSEKVNEEFIGKALKSLFGELKNRASIALSKQIGSAKEIESVIEKYKTELVKAMEGKRNSERALVEYHKGLIAGADADEKTQKDLEQTLTKMKDNFEKQKENIKKKYSIQFKKITENEKDDRVKEYLNLRKLELAQEILATEMKMIQDDLDVTDEDRKKSKFLDSLLGNLEQTAEGLDKKTDEIAKSIEEGGSSDDSPKFNIEEAKKNKDYFWKESPYLKSTFKEGDKIKFWSNTDSEDDNEYNGTEGFIGPDEKQTDEFKKEGNIWIYKDEKNPKSGFAIKRGKIITTASDQEAKAKEEESKDDEVDTTEEEN